MPGSAYEFSPPFNVNSSSYSVLPWPCFDPLHNFRDAEPGLGRNRQESLHSSPRFSAARFRVRSLPLSRSTFVATTRNSRPAARSQSSNCRSFGRAGTFESTRQMHSASVSRSARYGSMNSGHSAEIDFEIFA